MSKKKVQKKSTKKSPKKMSKKKVQKKSTKISPKK